MCAQIFTGCPARSGSSPAAVRPAHGFLERVVVPLLLGAGVFGAGRGGQRVQHGGDGLGALGRQVAVQDPGTLERGDQPHRPVIEHLAGVLVGGCGPGLLVDLPEQPGQVLQAHAGQGRRDEFVVREVTLVLRQPVRPLAHDPGHRLGQVPGRQRREDQRDAPPPAAPTRCRTPPRP